MPSAPWLSCAFVLVALAAAPGSFAASIEITNLRTFATPFGDRVTQAALNDHGDIAGTSFTSAIFDSQTGFIIPANGMPPVQIKNAAAQYTEVHGINNAGTVAGFYLGTDSLLHAFTYSAGTYTPVSAGPYTYLYGINNRGDLTGYYSNMGLTATGFLIQGGTTTTFALPGHPLDTFPLSINDADQIVGYTEQSSFLRQSDGSFQILDFGARGINNQGILVGSRGTGGGPNDAVFGIVSIGGTDYTFSYPGATQTYLYGINNANEVVGIYEDATFASHLFAGQLATPEPATAYLCGGALLGLAVFMVHRTRRKSNGLWCERLEGERQGVVARKEQSVNESMQSCGGCAGI